MVIPEVSVEELKGKLDAGEAPVLIDVREPHEVEIASIGGVLIPLKTLPERLEEIPKDRPVVVYCRSGGRSARACEFLLAQGWKNVANLKGGVLDWADRIDPSMTKY
jgi:rhodanese-related sulfurtransferase